MKEEIEIGYIRQSDIRENAAVREEDILFASSNGLEGRKVGWPPFVENSPFSKITEQKRNKTKVTKKASGWNSTTCSKYDPFVCRDEATRTPDPYVPNVVRYQLRYIPIALSLPKSACKGSAFLRIKQIFFWKVMICRKNVVPLHRKRIMVP